MNTNLNIEQPEKALVEQVIGKTGSRGGITQVKVALLKDPTRKLLRNVKGPCKVGDVLHLMESEREARRLR